MASLLATSHALASNGVLEINAACVQVGCFPGDAPDYPVTITGQAGRSYVLTSDLTVGLPTITGIVVAGPDVSIDLGGHGIVGFQVCDGNLDGCSYSTQTGYGIEATADRLQVSNGSIVGVGSKGIFASGGNGHVLRGLRISHTGRAPAPWSRAARRSRTRTTGSKSATEAPSPSPPLPRTVSSASSPR